MGCQESGGSSKAGTSLPRVCVQPWDVHRREWVANECGLSQIHH